MFNEDKPYIVHLEDDDICRWIMQKSFEFKGFGELINYVGFDNDLDAMKFVKQHKERIFMFLMDSFRPSKGIYDNKKFQNHKPAIAPYHSTMFYPCIADVFSPHAGQIYCGSGFFEDEQRFIDEWNEIDIRVNHCDRTDSKKMMELIRLNLLRWDVVMKNKSISYENTLIEPIEEEFKMLCAHKPNFLSDLSSRQFEKIIASIIKNNGFEVELTAKTRDGGYDIKAVSRSKLTNEVLLIEVKHYAPNNVVSVGIIRALYGVLKLNKATKAMLVTSSHVSKFAKNEFNRTIPIELELVERKQVLEWCNKYLKTILLKNINI